VIGPRFEPCPCGDDDDDDDGGDDSNSTSASALLIRLLLLLLLLPLPLPPFWWCFAFAFLEAYVRTCNVVMGEAVRSRVGREIVCVMGRRRRWQRSDDMFEIQRCYKLTTATGRGREARVGPKTKRLFPGAD
jgi:hypothetical protein